RPRPRPHRRAFRRLQRRLRRSRARGRSMKFLAMKFLAMKFLAMKFLGLAAFAIGLGVLVWLVMRFGVGPILHAMEKLGVAGLLVLAIIHLPAFLVTGLSWWRFAHTAPNARPHKFIWGRLLRDGAAEVLPLSQVGGFVIGARAVSLQGVPGTAVAIAMLS